MNKEKIYHVTGTGDRSRAQWLTDFSFPWIDWLSPETRFRAWHNEVNLYFEFQVEDNDIVLHDAGDDDGKVLGSDRVEIFISPTPDLSLPYYGFEIDPRGLIYDYRGVFHRKFDPAWTLPGLEVTAEITSEGYRVEGSFALGDLVELECLTDGHMIAGLYRGEFSHRRDGSVQENWISWVDPGTPTPDFHVPESFGLFILEN